MIAKIHDVPTQNEEIIYLMEKIPNLFKPEGLMVKAKQLEIFEKALASMTEFSSVAGQASLKSMISGLYEHGMEPSGSAVVETSIPGCKIEIYMKHKNTGLSGDQYKTTITFTKVEEGKEQEDYKADFINRLSQQLSQLAQ